MVAAVFGTDFEERISEKKWYQDYFNEVIYGQDRNILVEYQPRLKEPYFDIDPDFGEITYWFDDPGRYWDRLDCIKLDDSEYGYYIRIGIDGASYKVKKLTPDLYELELEDVRISRKEYEEYFRFDGGYLYIYLEDGKTLYATYCAYDGLEEEEALYEAIKTNEFDMTKITFPYHADGTCDYESGGGVPGKKIVNGVYRAQDNLRLRVNENTSGKAITIMQADTYVRILSLGITDNWVEVETQFGAKNLEGDFLYGKTGWCFGGYLR